MFLALHIIFLKLNSVIIIIIIISANSGGGDGAGGGSTGRRFLYYFTQIVLHQFILLKCNVLEKRRFGDCPQNIVFLERNVLTRH